MATMHVTLAVINFFSLWWPLRESYQRLIFHNSQLTLPSSVVIRNVQRKLQDSTLIVCLKCINTCYYMPIVRYSCVFAMQWPICRRTSMENHLFMIKIILHVFQVEIYTSIWETLRIILRSLYLSIIIFLCFNYVLLKLIKVNLLFWTSEIILSYFSLQIFSINSFPELS